SIIGQGRVEEILASHPEERREFIEEAAGLGRFKRRKHRAELKLARVSLQVARARDVEEEVRKRLRPLALQATAAERAEKLRGEVASLRARIAQLELAVLDERLSGNEETRTAAELARRRVDERLEALLADRTREGARAEREGLPPAARALAEQGERLALSLVEVTEGGERAVAAALGRSAPALLAADERTAFALVERARAAGLGNLVVLVGRDP